MWDAGKACPRVFRCTSPLLLRVLLVNLGGSFQVLLESALLVPVPLLPEGRAGGRVSTSLALSLDRPLGPPMAASEPPEGGDIPSLLLQPSALRRVPRGPPHLLSVVKASQALAVAQ